MSASGLKAAPALAPRHVSKVPTAEVRVRAILLQMLLMPMGTQSATPADMANC